MGPGRNRRQERGLSIALNSSQLMASWVACLGTLGISWDGNGIVAIDAVTCEPGGICPTKRSKIG